MIWYEEQLYSSAYSGDSRSAIPVIPVHSVVNFQYRRRDFI